MNSSAEPPPLTRQMMAERELDDRRVALPPARRRLLALIPALAATGCVGPLERATAQRPSEEAAASRPSGGSPAIAASAEPPVAADSASRPSSPPGLTGPLIPLFSTARPGDRLPAGWEEWLLHRTKKKTRYSLIRHEARTVLHARAEQSASGLTAPIGIELTTDARLKWGWRIAALIPDADNTVAETEDAPVRVVLSFDGPWEKLPARDRLFAERVRLIAGRELPYATLMYIWANRHPVGQVIDNPHTQRIRKLVVDSGDAELSRWRNHERRVHEDFMAVFGEPPGRLTRIGILTDTDNTRSSAEALYSDLILNP